MSEQKWQYDLEEYIRQGELGRVEKSEAWQTAIGLQAVDGLKTSEYLLDTAKEHIEGNITIDEAQKRIQSYYEQRTERTEVEDNTKEADIVSARIAKLLGEKSFQFSPSTTKFLEMFFGNLLLDTDYDLKNRIMHVDYVEANDSQSVTAKAPKSQFDTLDCTLEELAILELIKKNPAVKQQELADATGKSLSTIKRLMKSLQDKNYIRRESGKRYGKWEVLV